MPTFEDVTEKVGLMPLPMKAPHVEIQDFDNDGWPDIYVSIVKFADGKPYPVIFQQPGRQGRPAAFRDDAWAVNDFPTAEDRAIKRSRARSSTRCIKEKKIIYMAPGPSGDFDNDGRLDLFLPNWWVEAPLAAAAERDARRQLAAGAGRGRRRASTAWASARG